MAKMTKFALPAALGALLLANPALAQVLLQKDDPQVQQAQEDRTYITTTEDNDLLGGRLRPAFRIVASSEDSEAQITFSTHDEGSDGFSQQAFAITLTAPISKKTKRADFLTEGGLPSQLSLGFSFSASLVNLNDIDWNNGKISDLMAKSEANCTAKFASRNLEPAKLAEECETGVPFRNRKDLHLDAADAKQLEAWFQDPIKVLKKRSFVSFNVAGSVGTEEFEFFDSSTLAADSKRTTNYAVGASVGFLPHLDSHVFFVAGFEAKRTYAEADEATYCPTGGTGPSVKCTTGPFGPPEQEIDRKVTFTVRFAGKLPLGGGEKSPFGIDVTTAYDFHDKTWGVEAPIYFLVDKDNGLTGGLRGAYDSKEDEFQFGVFIGKTFDFLKL